MLAGCGAIAAGGALVWSATPAGVALWGGALVVACSGYGDLLARRIDPRASFGGSVVTGLAGLIVVSTVLARFGLLSRGLEFGAVGLGLALCAAGRTERAVRTGWPLCAIAMLAGVVLLGTQIVALSPWSVDGVNHTMEVKRLLDTGQLGALPHQLGGLIVGESYLALIGGAGVAGAFDAGLCATLVILVLAGELASRDDAVALPVFLILVLPIALNPEPTLAPVARWSGVLFHTAALFALHRSWHPGRDPRGDRSDRTYDRHAVWRIAPSALCLIALRWEYALIALPYLAVGVIAARDSVRSRSAVMVLAACWVAALSGFGDNIVTGAAHAVALTAVAALATRLILPLVSSFSWLSPFSVLNFAVITANFSSMIGLVTEPAHSGSVLSAIWFTAVIGVFALFDSEKLASRTGQRIYLSTWILATVVFLTMTILSPNFDPRRHDRLRDRFVEAVRDLQFAAVHGYNDQPSAAAMLLQRRIPPRAAIGLWGVSAGQLDYARNPISDLTWQDHRPPFSPLSRAALRGISYLLLEHVEPPTPPPGPRNHIDPWGEVRPSLTAAVDPNLELVAELGTLRMYRVIP
jgi:hypothetical protein